MTSRNDDDRLDPEIWLRHMRSGSFEQAWRFSDAVISSGANRDYLNIPRHYQCIWDGTPLDGKRVLIRCYHGLGDTIQFIRYTRLVSQVASEVIVWAQPKLINLLPTVESIDKVIPLHNGAPGISYDVDLEVMELPHIFRSTLLTLPADVPYIHVRNSGLGQKTRFTAGLVWHAGDWDESRNIPFDLLKPLFDIKNIDIHILQDNAADFGWDHHYGIHPGNCSLDEHAAIIRSLDLFITIDSMPAHLAGAMAVPVWLLISSKADWRWMDHGSVSPWYPTMKIFRQERYGEWEPVIRSVTGELQKTVERFNS